ncbi:MAG: hypothetical protein ACR2NZ_10955 [Rubripirellula sp.]
MNVRLQRWLRFAAATLVISLVWLVLLPRAARLESVKERIRRNDAAGIDPSAMFYSDLEHLQYRDGMLRHLEP